MIIVKRDGSRIDTKEIEIRKCIEVIDGIKYNIKDNSIVKVTNYINGDTTITHSKNLNRGKGINKYRRYSKNETINTDTGEIIEHGDNGEYKSRDDITRSMGKVKKKIHNNFFGNGNELFVTLTYREEVRDFEVVKNDMENFWDRVRRKYKDIEYIYVFEIQENRESWHIHILLKQKNVDKTTITNNDIQCLWGKGTTNTKEIYDIEKLTNYIAKTETKTTVVDTENNSNDLKVKKGKQLYGCSKGIKDAEEYKTEYKNAKEDVKDKQYTGSITKHIVQVTEDTSKDEEDENRYKEHTFNTIQQQYYKSKEQQ